MSDSARPSVLSGPTGPVLGRALTILLATLALTSVAFLNGFPLVDSDSGRYINSSFTYAVPPDRPVFYSLFMRLSRWIAPSLWATVLVQSLLTAVVIDAFLRARAATRPTAVWTLAVVLALTLASSVAWFTGLLMSDLFFGLMFLAVVTLVVNSHPGWRAALLLGVIAFAATVHNAALVTLPLFLVAVGGLAWGLPNAWRGYGAAWAALAVGVIAVPLVNASLGAESRLPPSGPVFLLSRWIGDGEVPRMLDDRCAIADYALCPYRDQLHRLTSNRFLWSSESPLDAIGGFQHGAGAAWPMLRDTLRYRPLDVFGHTLVNTGKQLLVFRTGWNAAACDESKAVVAVIRARFPAAYGDWQHSLQQQSRLQGIAWALNWVHVPVAAAGIVLLLAVALPGGAPGSPAVAPTSRFLARATLAFVLDERRDLRRPGGDRRPLRRARDVAGSAGGPRDPALRVDPRARPSPRLPRDSPLGKLYTSQLTRPFSGSGSVSVSLSLSELRRDIARHSVKMSIAIAIPTPIPIGLQSYLCRASPAPSW